MKRVYINLTNGIDVMDRFGFGGFVRIQSSHLESKQFDRVIRDLGYDFLLDCALGFRVVVVDASHRKVSRAIFQGLPWIAYVLRRRWNLVPKTPLVLGHDVSDYFDHQYRQLSKATKRKLDYVKKFLHTDRVRISGSCFSTTHDGKYDHYATKLRAELIGDIEEKG
jgi:hypothetical protein